MENNREQAHHLWHSYCINPDIRFESQESGEIPLLVLRAHPFTQLPWILNTIFIFIILFLIIVFLVPYLSPSQLFFILVSGLMFGISYVWFNFLNWFFNVGIISSKRIIDVDYYSVIYKEVSETHLHRVEDITSKTGGYFESFFDYGDVFIQTAGKEAHIEFLNVPKPTEVVRAINNLIGKK